MPLLWAGFSQENFGKSQENYKMSSIERMHRKGIFYQLFFRKIYFLKYYDSAERCLEAEIARVLEISILKDKIWTAADREYENTTL